MMALTPAAAPVRATVSMSAASDFVVGGKATPKDWTSDEIQDRDGLKDLALQLNPIVGYYDPFRVGDADKELIAWFRHAEIKHGRVAMAAFVGFCAQNTRYAFPWNLQGPIGGINLINTNNPPTLSDIPTISFADIAAAGGPCDQWDALPSSAKLQILFAVGLLELWGESSYALEQDGQQHYVRGGKPGYYPSLKGRMPHPVPANLWDPLGFTNKLSAEQKQKSLLAEINNGRWAMIGIMGMISASKGLIVPGLDSIGLQPYAGEPMAFFSAANADLPFVSDMLSGWTLFQ